MKLHVKHHSPSHGPSALLARLPLSRLRAWKMQLMEGFQYGNRVPQAEPHSAVAGPTSVKTAWFAPAERKLLLQIARTSLLSAVGASPESVLPKLPSKLLEQRACFVTLSQAGLLRGCMGNLLPRDPLYKTVMENTRNAALRDPRFPPVQENEVSEVQIEITVLSELQPLRYSSVDDLLNQLQPAEHGVFLQIGTRIATFLPQVWEQVPDRIQFLDRLAQKCGCLPSAWRDKDAQLCIYYAEFFAESTPAFLEN